LIVDTYNPGEAVFVVMPFAARNSPALGVSLLKSRLREHGIAARVAYPLLEFARTLGPESYDAIARGRPRMSALLGDWIFSHELRTMSQEDVERYVAVHLEGASPAFVQSVLEARERVPAFLDDALDGILRSEPSFVGFSSTFAQHAASLALARRLKDRAPGVPIVFGGANCEGDMGRETARSFPFVDAVVSGEADDAIAELARDVLAGRPPAKLYGYDAPPRTELDALPYPDFSDYFAALGGPPDEAVRLHFETSRGCWWGQKHHCTFCGLNGASLAFRAKSAPRALAEIEHLVHRYGIRKLSATDNILDARYLDTVVPRLARRDLGLELFYEVKANLRRDQLESLRAAGCTRLQPGIESLSTPVLRLMRKGVDGLQNIRLLKWCRATGVHPVWNALYGFPNEPPEEYQRLAELIPWLSHLTPPEYAGPLRLDRFSPYFEDPAAFGIEGVEPFAAYREVYGLPDAALRNLAYYFTFERGGLAYARPFADAVERWRADHERADLVAVDDGTRVVVCDYRPVAPSAVTVLEGLERAVLLACDDIRSPAQIRDGLAARGIAAAAGDVAKSLARLVARGFAIAEDERYLSIVVELRYARPALLGHVTSARAALAALR
jgi:ribosomal peptide maturation radical SAM protein 1